MMLATLAKLFRRAGAPSRQVAAVAARRSLDAAGGGLRWADDRSGGDAASWTHAGAGIVSARAQAYALNNPHGARIVQTLADNLVGTGIMPRSQHPSETVRRHLALEFLRWTDEADADGRLDLYGLMALAVRDMATFGEFVGILTADPVTGAPQIRRLHPEQLDRSKTLMRDGGATIVQGVEFTAAGRIAAYWIRPGAPGEALGAIAPASQRYPAGDVIHMFRPLMPGQVRGLSWFAPVLLTAKELDAFLDAMLVRVKTSAMFIGSISDIDGAGVPGEATGAGTISAVVEPGAVRIEQPGKHLEFNEPPDAGNTAAFASEILRMIAAGVGISFEQLTGNYSQSTYSSARAAILEFRRFCEGVQHHTIVYQFCRPLWRRFVMWEVLRGAIPARSYQMDRAAFEAVKWLPPAWPWVDRKTKPRPPFWRWTTTCGAGLRSLPSAVTILKSWMRRSPPTTPAWRALG